MRMEITTARCAWWSATVKLSTENIYQARDIGTRSQKCTKAKTDLEASRYVGEKVSKDLEMRRQMGRSERLSLAKHCVKLVRNLMQDTFMYAVIFAKFVAQVSMVTNNILQEKLILQR